MSPNSNLCGYKFRGYPSDTFLFFKMFLVFPSIDFFSGSGRNVYFAAKVVARPASAEDEVEAGSWPGRRPRWQGRG